MKKILLLLIIVSLSGCATMKTHSTQNTTQTREYNAAGSEVYKKAVQTAMEMKWNITMSDADVAAFSAKTPQTMSRWEDEVNVFVNEKEGISTITVRSNLGHEPNAKYIGGFLDNLSKKIE